MRYAKMPDEMQEPVLEAETPVTRRQAGEHSRKNVAGIESDASDDSEDEGKERKFNELNEQASVMIGCESGGVVIGAVLVLVVMVAGC